MCLPDFVLRQKLGEKRAAARQETAMAEKAPGAAANGATDKSKDAEKAEESESEQETECSNAATFVAENEVTETQECMIS